MRWILALLLIFTLSCAPGMRFQTLPIATFYPHAFLINHKNADYRVEQVAFVMQLMAAEFQDPKVTELFSHLTIIITDELPEHHGGLTYNGTIVYVRQDLITEKISSGSLPHELLHVVIRAQTGDGDSGHTSKLWTQFLPKFRKKLEDRGL